MNATTCNKLAVRHGLQSSNISIRTSCQGRTPYSQASTTAYLPTIPQKSAHCREIAAQCPKSVDPQRPIRFASMAERNVGPCVVRMESVTDRLPVPLMKDALPPRLTTLEVLHLARFSAQTLRRRQKRGLFPKAIPGEKGIYLRDMVMAALGLSAELGDSNADRFEEAANAFHRDRTSSERRKKSSG